MFKYYIMKKLNNMIKYNPSFFLYTNISFSYNFFKIKKAII